MEKKGRKPGLCHRLLFSLTEEKKEDERKEVCVPYTEMAAGKAEALEEQDSCWKAAGSRTAALF